MNPTIKLGSGGPGGKAILEGIKSLTSQQVYVGIPDGRASRTKGPINNAQLAFLLTNGVRSTDMRRIMAAAQHNRRISYGQALALYLHTYGSPRMQIPPAPIIEPAIEFGPNKKLIEGELRLAAKAALEGKQGEVKSHLRRAGLIAQNAVKGWFTNPANNWPSNAPSTIRRKGSDRRNIDTGSLRNAITFVVTE